MYCDFMMGDRIIYVIYSQVAFHISCCSYASFDNSLPNYVKLWKFYVKLSRFSKYPPIVISCLAGTYFSLGPLSLFFYSLISFSPSKLLQYSIELFFDTVEGAWKDIDVTGVLYPLRWFTLPRCIGINKELYNYVLNGQIEGHWDPPIFLFGIAPC